MDGIFHTFKSFVDTFREPDNNETTNKDILKLKQNILKIKNRKKNATNYSNIETLDNIYDGSAKSENDSILPNYTATDSVVENFQEGARNKKKKGKKKKSKKDKGKKKKSKFNLFMEKVGEFFNKTRKAFENQGDVLFYGYKQYDKLIAYIAFQYVYIICISTQPNLNKLNPDLSNATKSQSEKIESDTKTVKNIFHDILFLPLCIYATYNWFYLLVYLRPKENNSAEFERPFDDNIRTKISFDHITPVYVKDLIQFLFGYTIAPLYWVDKLFNNNMYTNFAVNYIDWNIANYFILFIAVLLINKFYGLFNSLLDYVSKNKFSVLLAFCSFVILTRLLLQSVKQFAELFKIPMILKSLLVIFIFIIIHTFIAGMSIHISSVLVLLYIWIHSLFGIVLYGKNKFSGIFEEMNNINEYIKKDYDKLQPEECDNLSFLQKIIIKVIKLLNDYKTITSFGIVIIINLIFSRFNYSSVWLSTIFLLLFFLIISYTIAYSLS